MKEARTFKTDAIILSTTNTQEHNRYFSCFSPDYGLIKATAFGAARSSSRFCSLIQPFTMACMRFSRSSRGDLIKLEEGSPIGVIDSIKANYQLIVYASFFCEVINSSYITPEENKKYYYLLQYSFEMLETGNSVAAAFLFFTSKFLFLSGYSFMLNGCRQCGTTDGEFIFSKTEGGLLCPRHARSGGHSLSLKAAVEWNHFLHDKYVTLREREVREDYFRILYPIIFLLIKDIFEKELKTVPMLRQVFEKVAW